MPDSVDIKISQDLIKPVIEAKIHGAIVDALGGQSALIESAVTSILQQKVDREGKPERYSGGVPFIQWLAQDTIRAAALDAIKQWAAENKAELRAAVIKAMSKQKGAVATAFVEGLARSMESYWTMTCNVKFNDKERS